MRSRPRLAVCACLAALSGAGCQQKDEAPAPLTSAMPPEATKPLEVPAGATPTAPASVAAPASAASGDGADAAGAARDSGASAKKASAGPSIKGCCAALRKAAKNDPKMARRFEGAAATCDGLAKSVSSGSANAAAARTTLRAQLHGLKVPGGC